MPFKVVFLLTIDASARDLTTEDTDLTRGIHFENRGEALLELSRGGKSSNDGHAIGDV